MALTPTTALIPLSRPIEHALGRLARRVRGVAALRGLGMVGVLGSAVAIVGMGADFLGALPESWRWGVWSIWVATLTLVIARWVIRPLVWKIGLLDLAALAERSATHLGERLTSAIGLIASPHGSPTLIQATTADAAARVAMISPSRTVPHRRAVAWLLAGTIAVSVIVIPSVLQPDPIGQLARRFLMPWANLDRVSRFVIEVPPDQLVAIGSDLEVIAVVRDRFDLGLVSEEKRPRAVPENATLEWADRQGTQQRVKMFTETNLAAPSRQFLSVVPNVQQSLTFRVRSGSALSRAVRVTAQPAPEITRWKAVVTAPSYIKQADLRLSDPAKIEAWEGSTITLTIEPSVPLKRAQLHWPDTESTSTSADLAISETPTIDVIATKSGDFRFDLVDVRGLKSRPHSPRRIVVRTDAPPSVTLAKSEDLKEARPDDVILASVKARDDLAVVAAEIHWSIVRSGSTQDDPTEQGMMPLPLNGLGTPSAQGDASFDLRKLKLNAGSADPGKRSGASVTS